MNQAATQATGATVPQTPVSQNWPARSLTYRDPRLLALIFVTPDGENSIVVAPGANNSVTPGYVAGCAPRWANADLVVMQQEVPMATVEHVAATCREDGTRFLLK